MLKRMDSGGIPSVCYFCLVMPLMGAPLSGGVKLAQISSIVNLVVFMAIAALVALRSGSLGVANPTCSVEPSTEYFLSSGGSDVISSLCIDTTSALSLFILVFHSSLPAIKKGEDYVKLLRSGQQADTVRSNRA
jgi:hypothetical protein